MITYTSSSPAPELDTRCESHCALVSVIPVAPDPLPAVPPPPRALAANGIGAYLEIRTAASSRTNDAAIVFGADPSTYRLRLGWNVRIVGGEGRFTVRQLYYAEPLPFLETFLLTVLAPGDGLLVVPRLGNTDGPAPYTFLRVLRGAVLDESGTAVPLDEDLPLTWNYWIPRNALYQLGVRL